jgi:hypothetical protein
MSALPKLAPPPNGHHGMTEGAADVLRGLMDQAREQHGYFPLMLQFPARRPTFAQQLIARASDDVLDVPVAAPVRAATAPAPWAELPFVYEWGVAIDAFDRFVSSSAHVLRYDDSAIDWVTSKRMGDIVFHSPCSEDRR